MRKFFLVVSLLSIFSLAVTAAAEEMDVKVDVSADYYKVDGETAYRISGSDFLLLGDRGVSELEFPIDATFTRLGIHGNFLKRVDVSFDYAWSIEDDAGTFTDLDWSSLVSADPFATGRGKAEIDAKEWNFDIKYLLKELEIDNSIINKMKLLLGGGFKFQEFQYDVKDLRQTSPYFPSFVGNSPGKFIDYEVEYDIWYLSFYVDFLNLDDNINLLLGMEYGPNIDAEDIDDHLLREKRSSSNGEGTYTKFAVLLNWNVWKNLFAAVYYNYVDIDVSGDQDQVFYDGSGIVYNNIDWESDSEQNIYGVKFTWLFE